MIRMIDLRADCSLIQVYRNKLDIHFFRTVTYLALSAKSCGVTRTLCGDSFVPQATICAPYRICGLLHFSMKLRQQVAQFTPSCLDLPSLIKRLPTFLKKRKKKKKE